MSASRRTDPPTLEPLRKRAKQLVRQHRDGVRVVAQRIRRSHPAFGDATDREILAADFSLAQAQAIVAREHGFDDWAALKEHLDMAPNDPKTNANPASAERRLRPAHPQIFVTDFARALAFYRDALGFAVDFTYGEPAFYGLVVRDEARLNLRHVDTSPFIAGRQGDEELLSATIAVDDVKALYQEYLARDVPMHETLQKKPWGMRSFVVRDPDGNLVAFNDPADDEVYD